MDKRNSRNASSRMPIDCSRASFRSSPASEPKPHVQRLRDLCAPTFVPSVLTLSFISSEAIQRSTKAIRSFCVSLFDCRVAIFALTLFLAGCGAPGDPVPPSPLVPAAITDLAAQQAGDGVRLTFSMPSKTIRGEHLAEPPAIEVLRGTPKPDGSPDANSFRVVDDIPGALAGKYEVDDHIQFISPVAPDAAHAHPGGTVVYRVRTRASIKRASSDSNSVMIRLFPVPERIASVQSEVTETAIDLHWPAVTRTSGGDPIVVAEYHVYRGELDPRAHDPATKDVLHEKWIVPLALLATTNGPDYRDMQFEFGKTYVYVVRAVATSEGNPLESSDSDPLILNPADTFPPATPQGLVAAVLGSPDGASAEVDLSWSINAEPDLAGYRVYRSEQESDKGKLVTPDLLPSPAYRDTSVALGHSYWYRVSAVDRSGNESAPSPPVAADVAQHFP
jgi:hypothetical protein